MLRWLITSPLGLWYWPITSLQISHFVNRKEHSSLFERLSQFWMKFTQLRLKKGWASNYYEDFGSLSHDYTWSIIAMLLVVTPHHRGELREPVIGFRFRGELRQERVLNHWGRHRCILTSSPQSFLWAPESIMLKVIIWTLLKEMSGYSYDWSLSVDNLRSGFTFLCLSLSLTVTSKTTYLGEMWCHSFIIENVSF